MNREMRLEIDELEERIAPITVNGLGDITVLPDTQTVTGTATLDTSGAFLSGSGTVGSDGADGTGCVILPTDTILGVCP